MDSINFQGSFGYGSTVFIGNGAQLKRVHLLEQETYESEEDIKYSISDTEIETENTLTSEKPIERNESAIMDEKKPESQLKETNSKETFSEGSEQKSGFSVHHFKLFAPIKALGEKLSKIKDSVSYGPFGTR